MAPLLTIDECSQILRLARSTIYKMISRRELKHIKCGSRVMFRVEDLEEYCLQRTIEPLKSRI